MNNDLQKFLFTHKSSCQVFISISCT